MADFNIAIELIFSEEGGYSNKSNDLGGETNYGISKREFPHLDIKNITLEQAREILKTYFWDKYRIEEIINQNIANYIFSMIVNAGYTNMTKRIQLAYNDLHLKNLVIDGVMGSATIEAINLLLECQSLHFLDKLRLQRIRYYTIVAREDKYQIWNLIGWISRALK